MAAQHYLNDLSSYLSSGTLSDLTVGCGEKAWQVHSNLACCHSMWFRKALTGDFAEKHSSKINLKDDPMFVDGIDCMISYFYSASYDVTKYDTSVALLHAQVAVMADKYACGSLYKLAQTRFGKAISTAEKEDWVLAANLVYEHTNSEASSHKKLRHLVAASAATWTAASIRAELVLELLHSNAQLATDLALAMFTTPTTFETMLICTDCQYSHLGSKDCPNAPFLSLEGIFVCPKCRVSITSTRFSGGKFRACGQCPGKHRKRFTQLVKL